MNEADIQELIDNYHTARVAIDNPSRWERLNWAAKQFSKTHPEVKVIQAYKAVDEATRL